MTGPRVISLDEAERQQRRAQSVGGDYVPPGEPAYVPAYTKGLISLTGGELLKREFPRRETLLAPWLPNKGLAMIYAERGIGKTWIGLGVAHTVAGAGSFLRWRAQARKRVVYIDGEMPPRTSNTASQRWWKAPISRPRKAPSNSSLPTCSRTACPISPTPARSVSMTA